MNKTWLITGVSTGLGRLLTEKALARGDHVIGTSRSKEALSGLRARHAQQLQILALDVTDPEAVRQLVDQAFARTERIDVVVSNAGYGVFGAAEECRDAQAREVLDVNLLGSMHLIRASLPHLRAQGGGRIVQVSSEGGQRAYPGFSLYHASKWGIEGFVEAVRQEVATFGIELVLVEPGPARTDFGRHLDKSAPMAVYDGTPVRALRDGLDGGWVIKGDPQRMAQAMLELATQAAPLPRRLVLGGDAYAGIKEALLARLAELETQKALAVAADFTADELARGGGPSPEDAR